MGNLSPDEDRKGRTLKRVDELRDERYRFSEITTAWMSVAEVDLKACK